MMNSMVCDKRKIRALVRDVSGVGVVNSNGFFTSYFNSIEREAVVVASVSMYSRISITDVDGSWKGFLTKSHFKLCVFGC